LRDPADRACDNLETLECFLVSERGVEVWRLIVKQFIPVRLDGHTLGVAQLVYAVYTPVPAHPGSAHATERHLGVAILHHILVYHE